MLVTLGAVTLGLSACSKPIPEVTIYGDGHSLNVPAARYTFPNGEEHVRITDYGKAPTIKVQVGTDLLVDVPRELSTHAWVVAAFTLDPSGKATPLSGTGGAVHDTHSARLTAPPSNIANYFLQVAELRGAKQTGGWIVHVKVSG
jgi:hypothetical protein